MTATVIDLRDLDSNPTRAAAWKDWFGRHGIDPADVPLNQTGPVILNGRMLTLEVYVRDARGVRVHDSGVSGRRINRYATKRVTIVCSSEPPR